MSSEKGVEKAFQDAVDRALCRASREPIENLMAEGSACAARRINGAMLELKKLREGWDQPNYTDCDVALFYTQWYLPQQVNIAYSHSLEVLRQRPLSSWGKNKLLLVDYGAGTGAMIIGLSLALSIQPKEHLPDRIGVVRIDHSAMLDLGDAIWSGLRDEITGQPILDGVAEVMDKAGFEGVAPGNERKIGSPSTRKDAERWVTAIHVVYEQGKKAIDAKFDLLCDRVMPHVRIRTVPSLKMPLLESDLADEGGPLPVDLCLTGSAQRMTRLRARLRNHFGDKLSSLSTEYLTGSVPWTHIGKNNSPLAETVYRPGVSLDA